MRWRRIYRSRICSHHPLRVVSSTHLWRFFFSFSLTFCARVCGVPVFTVKSYVGPMIDQCMPNGRARLVAGMGHVSTNPFVLPTNTNTGTGLGGGNEKEKESSAGNDSDDDGEGETEYSIPPHLMDTTTAPGFPSESGGTSRPEHIRIVFHCINAGTAAAQSQSQRVRVTKWATAENIFADEKKFYDRVCMISVRVGCHLHLRLIQVFVGHVCRCRISKRRRPA